MYRTAAEIVFTLGVVVATLTDTASAQNSSGSAALDTSLRGAVERKDVPGVVALITDRERVLIRAYSAWRTWRPGALSQPTRYFVSPQ